MISLKKGERISLKKEDGGELRRIMVGLGWGASERKRQGLFCMKAHNVDIDSSVFMLKNGVLKSDSDIIYYRNLEHKSGTVRHMGDDIVGGGDVNADNEQIYINLDRVPADYDKLVVVANIFEASSRHQHFGMIRNAFIHILDTESGQDLLRYDLSEDYEGKTAMIVGELYRKDGGWKFAAMGNATTDNSIAQLAGRYNKNASFN